jgi:hypothetical protein
MPYRITVRLNTRTGEFETFQVDALETEQPSARHNRDHEEVAAAMGRLVERRPAVEEVSGADGVGAQPIGANLPDGEEQTERNREAQQQGGG